MLLMLAEPVHRLQSRWAWLSEEEEARPTSGRIWFSEVVVAAKASQACVLASVLASAPHRL